MTVAQDDIGRKSRGRWLRSALLLVTLIAFLLAFVAGAIWLWRSISGSDSDVLVAVVAAGASVIVSALGITLGRYNERRKETEQRRQEKRIPVYEDFIDFWFTKVLYAERLGHDPPDTKELNQFFATFTRNLMIWGSDEVILKWGEVRRRWANWGERAPEERTGAPEMLGFESLLVQMRRDVGYPDTSLPPGSILGLFIDDADSLVAAQSPAPEHGDYLPSPPRGGAQPSPANDGAPAKPPRRGRGRTRRN